MSSRYSLFLTPYSLMRRPQENRLPAAKKWISKISLKRAIRYWCKWAKSQWVKKGLSSKHVLRSQGALLSSCQTLRGCAIVLVSSSHQHPPLQGCRGSSGPADAVSVPAVTVITSIRPAHIFVGVVMSASVSSNKPR